MTAAADPGTADQHDRNLGRIARGGSANLAGTAAGAVLTLVVTWLVTTGADQSVAGSLFAATSVFLIAAALAELGSDVSLAKFLPHFLVDRRIGDAVTVVRVALAVTVIASLVAAGVLIGLRGWIGGLLAGPGDHRGLELGLLVLAVAIPAAAVMNTALSASRGLATIRPTVLVDRVGRNVAQVAAITVAVAAGAGISGLAVAWATPYALAAVAALAWLALLLRRVGRTGPDDRPAGTRRELLREYAAYTWPRATARIAQSVLQRADIVLVAVLRSPAEAAVYTVATRFLVVGQLGTQAIQQVVAPQISRMFATGERSGARQIFQTATAWNITLNWPMFLLFAGVAPLLLQLFGGEPFREGDQVVVILSIAALAAAAGGSIDILLLMAGRSGLSLVNSLVALAVNLIANVLLIPPLGMTGAALAWASAIAVRNLLGMIQVWRSLGWLPFSRAAAAAAGLAIVAFGLPALALRITGEPTALTAVATFAGATGVYAAGLWRFRRALGLAAFASLLPGQSGARAAGGGRG